MRRGREAIAPACLAALVAMAANADEQPGPQADFQSLFPSYQGELSSLADVNVWNARLEVVADGFVKPWAFEFLSDRELIFTELGGAIGIIDLESGARRDLAGVSPVAAGFDQTGLLDIALHPDFANNRRLYYSYAKADPQSDRLFLTAVDTAVLAADRLEQVRTVLEAGPYSWSPANFGGALAFDGDGMLLVTIGDRSLSDFSQRLDRLEGKLLRLHDDGRVPADNPFVDVEGADPRIYALGLRNPQGLHWDPASGLLLESEHGPRGGDEVNLVEAGANYGWPLLTYGADYTLATMGEGTHRDGFAQPLWYYLPSVAVSPLTVYRGEMFPEWDGDVLVGALKGQHVSKLDLDGTVVRSEAAILGEIGGRIRDIRVGPGGAVFVLSENGRLYRLSRDPAGQPRAPGVDISLLYRLVCSSCHDNGAYGAPRVGHAEDWTEVRARERAEVDRITREGKGLMPARGMCYQCTDEHLEDVVDYMLSTVDETGAGSGQ